jgi:hypothetical protein
MAYITIKTNKNSLVILVLIAVVHPWLIQNFSLFSYNYALR